MANSVLSVKGLSVQFQTENETVKAVDNISFDIFEAETFGLVGESGSGKSTIAKIISSLINPSSGEIYFDNISLFDPKNKVIKNKFRGQIQMVFQDPYSSLNPRYKVKNIIAEPIKFFQKNHFFIRLIVM